MKNIILVAIILILASSNVWAQHEEHKTYYSKHHIAIFDGATTNFGHSTTGYSLGLDYEYRISDKIGVGMIGEYVFTGEGELILGVPLFFHPTSNIKLGAAPIGIYAEGHHGYHSYGDQEPIKNTVHKEWVLGARLNLAYSLHFGKISAGPSVSLDVANTTALIYGLAFGIGI